MRRLPSSWSTTIAKLGLSRKARRCTVRRASHGRRTATFEPLEERTLFAVFTWDGGGGDNNWSTAANWVGDLAPAAGDDLVFSGAVRTSTSNNFSNGTSFNSITFAANNFSLAGNRIALADDIDVNSGIIGSSISLNIAVGASVSIDVVDTALTISGVLSGLNSVTKAGDGVLVFSGASTYSPTSRSHTHSTE